MKIKFPSDETILRTHAGMIAESDRVHGDNEVRPAEECEICTLAGAFMNSDAAKAVYAEAAAGLRPEGLMAMFFILGLKCGQQQAYESMAGKTGCCEAPARTA